MLNPLRQQLNCSPFRKNRQQSKENLSKTRDSYSPVKKNRPLQEHEKSSKKQGREKQLVMRCDKGTQNVKVHKSIAEDIFKEMQNSKIINQKQNQNERQRDLSKSNKVEYSPSKPIRDQVSEYIKQRESVLKQKIERQVIVSDARKENTPVKMSNNTHKFQPKHQINGKQTLTNRFSQGVLKQQKQKQTILQNSSTFINDLKLQRPSQQPYNLNQSQSSLNLSMNHNQQKVLVPQQIPDQKQINSDLQQYQSITQHYRSRSSLGLKSQALQSTQYLQELRNSPIYKRRRQQSMSQSPSKYIQNDISKILRKNIAESILETESITNLFDKSPSKQSTENKFKRDRRQPSIDLTSSTRSLSRNGMNFRKSALQEIGQKTIQDIINETGKFSMGGNQSDFRLTMTPILEIAKQNQQTWIQKQIQKEKQKSTKNFQNLSISKSTTQLKKI
eukprot:403340195